MSFLRSLSKNLLFSFHFNIREFQFSPILGAGSCLNSLISFIFFLSYLPGLIRFLDGPLFNFSPLAVSLQTLIQATLRSLLNSCTGLRNASLFAGSSMCVVFSVWRVKPSGTATDLGGDNDAECTDIERQNSNLLYLKARQACRPRKSNFDRIFACQYHETRV